MGPVGSGVVDAGAVVLSAVVGANVGTTVVEFGEVLGEGGIVGTDVVVVLDG